ncbi:MAG: dynamin family protein [Methylococcaceae bacterium]|nr:dynamin family protein [Methylococcaceae bacterium]MDD1626766.1 dynamin family protein [Methylococcaceae bacterium]
MRNPEFKELMHEYSQWRAKLIQSIKMYQQWRNRYGMNDSYSTNIILNILTDLEADRITLAFVAEFSRGKTELINALFFAETGVRLLPSSPGRTTMAPTELFYDEAGGSYIRLLAIESRLEDISLAELKKTPERWVQFKLDCDSPKQMQETFKELIATKTVDRQLADKLGLWNEREAAAQGIIDPEKVEIPFWRHALISFPHPLLKEGLAIIDTPGLNALGTEPELTLNMLPSAQAIVFVLAADTGVTKSDMEMWLTHICRAHGKKNQGLAVVMNKIDTMWDDLADTNNYEDSIKSQVAASAAILKINENTIFPVSAKQALLAKVKGDDALFTKSRLGPLENYLASDILKQKRNILMETVTRDIGFLINESSNTTSTSLSEATNQLEEFKKIDFQNQDMTGKLMAETRDRQNLYMANIENFQASRRVFIVQAKMLIDSFAREKVDAIISNAKHDIATSLTTYGMKQNIRKLFDDLRDLLQDAIDITNETRGLVKAIHKKFKDDYGFKEIEPQLFYIKQYQIELEQIFAEGEAFRSSTKVTMTEQSIVIEKLYSTLIAKARDVISQAQADAITWCQGVLMPLMRQIKDHKKQIENRLLLLKKLNSSKGSIAENIAVLETELVPLKRQRDELSIMIKSMQLDSYSTDNS